MEVNFKIEKQNSRKDVAEAFNKKSLSINVMSRNYKLRGGRKGLISSNQQVPFAVFSSRIIRNTPKEFYGFFLDDNNFKKFDIVKSDEERAQND